MVAALNEALALPLAQVALANVAREYPYHVLHLLRGDADMHPPRELHPAFHGSYDWHSCVHMHWTLARCLRRFPRLAAAPAIRAHFDARLTAGNVAREIDYFEAPGRGTFERPYGWGWLLALQAELRALADADSAAAGWRDALAPLARLIAQRCVDWLPRQDYPVRNGTHANSAFALIHAQRYAQVEQHRALRAAISDRANAWFARDRRYPADYEPAGDDFLSGGLCEALLVLRAVDDCDFADWWQAFEPAGAALARWLTPVSVSDPADAKIVHLHGLNLSRALCWRALAPHLPPALQAPVAAAVAGHIEASLPAATAGDYVGTHWLASFAVLALDGLD
ncbi:MAG: DUF2891 domain-containing protein [Gemmatimonadota bacterium]